MEHACANGSPRIKTILQHDSCLFNPITSTEVTFPYPPATQAELEAIEADSHRTNKQHFQILQNRGRFRLLSTSSNPADQFLVYTPNTRPYNPSAPLRNTIPYIPLVFNQEGVEIDPLLPDEFVNPSVKTFLDNMNSLQTPELVAEQNLIREQLGLEELRSELNHLGSVMEDDAIELAPNTRELMEQFSKDFGIPLPADLPPRSLKEIYQLPHKGKGVRGGEGEVEGGEKSGGKKETKEMNPKVGIVKRDGSEENGEWSEWSDEWSEWSEWSEWNDDWNEWNGE